MHAINNIQHVQKVILVYEFDKLNFKHSIRHSFSPYSTDKSFGQVLESIIAIASIRPFLSEVASELSLNLLMAGKTDICTFLFLTYVQQAWSTYVPKG